MVHGKVIGVISAALCLGAQSAPISAQAVNWSDLDGVVVDAEIHRDQRTGRHGLTASVAIHQTWRISIAADKSLEFTVTTTARGPGAPGRPLTNSGTATLDEPRQVPSFGGGTTVWEFADGTLTFFRTFRSGAYRAHFAFVRAPSGLACSVSEAFARENGTGEIRMQPDSGGEITIISSKLLASSCKVTERQR
jgi:hypothetical protein